MFASLPWLTYLIPPLLGALIGYVTNYIAIRMLFRPLDPWHLLGIRLPLTPGIIPAKRKELAQRMGAMVGSHLLTADDVRQALEKPSFNRELKHAVNIKLGSFLERDLGPLDTLVPSNYQRRFRELVNTFQAKTLTIITEYFASETFEKQLRHYIESKSDDLLTRDLESFLNPSRYQDLINHLESRLSAILQSEETRLVVERFVDQRIERLLQSDRSLRDLLPDDLVAMLLQQVEKEVPSLLERFGGLLYDPDFRARLVLRARKGIDSFIDSLGGLAGLLSGFINLDQVYNKIPAFLDKAGEEISLWLRTDKTQEQVTTMLCERLENFLEKPINSYLEKAPYEKVAGARRYLSDRTVAAIQSRRTTEMLLNFTIEGLNRFKDRPFRSLLEENLPSQGLETLKDYLCDYILNMIRSNEAEMAIEKVLIQKTDEIIYRQPLGRLAERCPADVLDELEDSLYRQVGEVLQKEVPPLIETLNIAQMVEEKVNQLSILEVESLLLGVMKEQFKYINLFGAILGFLIGLLNIAVWGWL